MMIRINLLPVRQVKKREEGRQFLVALAGVLVIAVLGNSYWYLVLSGDRDKRQRKLDDTTQRIAQLEKVIGEVNNLNKRKKEVEDKLKVLGDLRTLRTGPIKLLDALATAIPKKVFVTEFDAKAETLKLTGQAESLDDVSDFMRGLNTMVWTPKGMGRVVEVKRDGSSYRVELVGAAIEDFPGPEVAHFFSNIELKGSMAENSTAAARGTGARVVKFELALNVNYKI